MGTMTSEQSEIDKVVHALRGPLINLEGFHQELEVSIHQILHIIEGCRGMLPNTVNDNLNTIVTDDVLPILNYLSISTSEMQKGVDTLDNASPAQSSSDSQ